ncbi:MAG TPA: DUF362 domain-containing protein [Bryobacteraceae bacterium]|nr:DUF362 domain-containing protein [Bryobacteraceae bacterium]
MTRRKFALLSGAAIVGGYTGIELQKLKKPAKLSDGPPGKSVVAIVRARSYSDDLVNRMLEGIAQVGLDVRGKRVLLKPNLVEFDPATVINTNPMVIAAAVEVFHKLGAAEVKIGEGPGHRRDTLDMADDARYREIIPRFESIFTDLNRDDVSAIANFAGEQKFYFPHAVLGADLIVSLAKMKTHHWAGATLSMKNFFGVVPGSIYGWPKNKLHYYGIPESIVALHRQFSPKSFAIVDGVVAMEGNGPIQGTPKPMGVLVMGRDLVAVDATCCRVMGIDPEKVGYLRMAADSGHVHPERIDQRGETIASVRSNFALIDDFKDLRLG